MSDEKPLAKRPDVAVTRAGLIPQNFEDMWRVSQALLASGLTRGNGLDTTEKVFYAVELGQELDIGAVQAVQNIAVINGKVCIWGDMALAIVERSGLMEDFRETPIEDNGEIVGYTCWAKRKGRPTPITHTFTRADAEHAGLWGKRGTWENYPQRMLQMRARGFVLRDGFADALKGLITREEAQDMIGGECRILPAKSRTEETLRLLEVPAEDASQEAGIDSPDAQTSPIDTVGEGQQEPPVGGLDEKELAYLQAKAREAVKTPVAAEAAQQADRGDKAPHTTKGTRKAPNAPKSAAKADQAQDFRVAPVEQAEFNDQGYIERYVVLVADTPVATLYQDKDGWWVCDGPSAECQIAECEHVGRARSINSSQADS